MPATVSQGSAVKMVSRYTPNSFNQLRLTIPSPQPQMPSPARYSTASFSNSGQAEEREIQASLIQGRKGLLTLARLGSEKLARVSAGNSA